MLGTVDRPVTTTATAVVPVTSSDRSCGPVETRLGSIGKGTQGKILGQIPNFIHFSSGDNTTIVSARVSVPGMARPFG